MRPLPLTLVLSLATACAESAFVADAGVDVADDSAASDGPHGPDASDAGRCDTPLDDDVLGHLVISFEDSISLRPGQSFQFQTSTFECCYYLEPVTACASWSVLPEENAEISPTGLLEIEERAEHGTVHTVTADIENGRRLVTAEVHVYTPEGNPMVGLWREAAQIECGSGVEGEPELPIEELRFKADGVFFVTWQPFEIYFDYWGDYDYDLGVGSMDLAVTGGNYVPSDVDPTGTFTIDAGDLVLEDLWLGTPQGGSEPARCGHRFVRP